MFEMQVKTSSFERNEGDERRRAELWQEYEKLSLEDLMFIISHLADQSEEKIVVKKTHGGSKFAKEQESKTPLLNPNSRTRIFLEKFARGFRWIFAPNTLVPKVDAGLVLQTEKISSLRSTNQVRRWIESHRFRLQLFALLQQKVEHEYLGLIYASGGRQAKSITQLGKTGGSFSYQDTHQLIADIHTHPIVWAHTMHETIQTIYRGKTSFVVIPYLQGYFTLAVISKNSSELNAQKKKRLQSFLRQMLRGKIRDRDVQDSIIDHSLGEHFSTTIAYISGPNEPLIFEETHTLTKLQQRLKQMAKELNSQN